MGQVFRGVHIYLNRPAAIKVMRPHLAANAKFRARFLQEAQAVAALKHPNTIDLYEFGEQKGRTRSVTGSFVHQE
jgi:serine/threonine protein kinase